MAITRPALRYLGGKYKLASWVIAHLPPHHLYVEPYGGAMSVLLRKPPSGREVYNDLDGEVVNLFRVLREPADADRLIQLISLTPYSREEFEAAYTPTADRVERARRLVVRSFMGFGSCAANLDRNSGFRMDARRAYATPAQEWGRYPGPLRAIAERVQCGVQIEQRPALQVIAERDAPDALFFLDPPYVHSTRSSKRKNGALHNAYAHEMTDGDHGQLLEALQNVRGGVVLSGYRNDLYDFWLTGWRRVERATFADGARPRTECLWLNPAAVAGLEARP